MVRLPFEWWQLALIWASVLITVPLGAYKMTFGVARRVRNHQSLGLGIASAAERADRRGVLTIEVVDEECRWLPPLIGEGAVISLVLSAPIVLLAILVALEVLALLAYVSLPLVEAVVLRRNYGPQRG